MGTVNKLLGSVVAIFIILMGLPVAMAVYQGSFTQQEFDAWLLDPEVQASIHSDAANTDDLGSTTREWRDLYLGDAGNILFGNAQDVDLGRSGADTLTLATGDTLAITSAGSLTVAGNAVADVGGFTMSGGDINVGGNDVTVVNTLSGSNNANSLSVNGWVTGGAAAQRDIVFSTGNAVDPQVLATRFTIGSNAAEATGTWVNLVHSGFKLGGAMDANAQDISNTDHIWMGRTSSFTNSTRALEIDAGDGASNDASLLIAGSRTADGSTATINFANWGNTGSLTSIAQIRGRCEDFNGDTTCDALDTGKLDFVVKKDDDATLNKVMTIDSNGGLSFPAFALSIPDNGNGGTAAAYTFTPTTDAARLVEVTCLDAQGCDVTMGETSVKNGQVVTFVNVAANVVNYADSAGVSELAGAFAAGINDVLHVYYSTALTTWIETGRSDN